MKRSKKKVTKAQNGYPNAWEMQGNGMYQYPQGYYPQMNYFGENPQITQENQIFPQSEMQIQPIQQSQQLQQPSQQKGPGMGGMAAGIGRGIGQAMSAFAIGAPQLINAMLPEDNRFREDMTMPRAVNRYPQGTGSQAIYEYGGEVAKNGYRTRKRRQNNIQITEEIPLEDNLQPLPQRGYVDRAFSFKPQPVNLPPVPEQRDISFQRMLDVHGQPTAYLPQFQGYSYNEATQALPQLPESFGGVPVVRSPQNYLDFFQGFLPGTQASQWTPYDQMQDYTPLPLTPFENGGKVGSSNEVDDLYDEPVKNLVNIPTDLEGVPWTPPDITKNQSYDKLTFSSAFKRARKDLGPGNVFEWKGKKYTTNLAEEETIVPSQKKRAASVSKADPKTQKVGTYEDFFYNVMNGMPDTGKPVTSTMQQFNPAFRSDFDLNLPKEESVYRSDRPAPKGLQKIAQDPQFNKWVEDVFIPATAPLDVYGIGAATKSVVEAGLKNAAKQAGKIKNAATRNMALENVRKAEAELGQYNLQQARKSAPYPAQQWEKNPGNFEWQSQSPYSKFANEPTIVEIGSPYQQVLEMEDMIESPFQQVFPLKQPNNWTPLQTIDITPTRQPMTTNFRNGGYIVGKEYDLSPEEIMQLLSQGYEIDIK